MDELLSFFSDLNQINTIIDEEMQCKQKIKENFISFKKELIENKICSFLDNIYSPKQYMIQQVNEFFIEKSNNFETFNKPSENFISEENELKNSDIVDRLKEKIKEQTILRLNAKTCFMKEDNNEEIIEKVSEEEDNEINYITK